LVSWNFDFFSSSAYLAFSASSYFFNSSAALEGATSGPLAAAAFWGSEIAPSFDFKSALACSSSAVAWSSLIYRAAASAPL